MRYFVVVGAMIAVLASLFLVPRDRRAPHRNYPPAPGAIEEGGEQDTPTAPARTRVSSPSTMAQKPEATTPTLRPAPPLMEVPAASSPSFPQGYGVRVPSGRKMREGEDRAGQPSSDKPQTAGEPGGPSTGPAQVPALTPPVLLTPVAGYPAEGYQVMLDRTILTPRLRVEAAQGRVVLRILVRADGSVEQVNVVESSGSPVLDEAAVRAATGWSFVPATRDGQPVESWAIIPIRFVVP